MSRAIDKTKTLEQATEHDLLIALGDIWIKRDVKHMTRSSSTEAHHQLLYAIGHLTDLKVHLEAHMEDTDWRHVVLECQKVSDMMRSTIEYVTTGKGGTSSLGDRNTR